MQRRAASPPSDRGRSLLLGPEAKGPPAPTVTGPLGVVAPAGPLAPENEERFAEARDAAVRFGMWSTPICAIASPCGPAGRPALALFVLELPRDQVVRPREREPAMPPTSVGPRLGNAVLAWMHVCHEHRKVGRCRGSLRRHVRNCSRDGAPSLRARGLRTR